MKEYIKKIDQLAEELIRLRDLSKGAGEEKRGLNAKMRNYQIEFELVDKDNINYSMPTQMIVEQRNKEKERINKLISDTECTKNIIDEKLNSIHKRIMEVKGQLSEVRGEYLEAYQKTLLNDHAFVKSLKLVAECVNAGNVAFEGYFNKDSFIERLFNNLPDDGLKDDLKIKSEVRADVVLGLGRY